MSIFTTTKFFFMNNWEKQIFIQQCHLRSCLKTSFGVFSNNFYKIFFIFMTNIIISIYLSIYLSKYLSIYLGRMALLVTLFLVLVNIFNSVTANAPKVRLINLMCRVFFIFDFLNKIVLVKAWKWYFFLPLTSIDHKKY